MIINHPTLKKLRQLRGGGCPAGSSEVEEEEEAGPGPGSLCRGWR
jgi:hypothetical protein